MLSPYTFCETVFRIRFEEPRRAMAELALNLYYGGVDHPFDVSRIFSLDSSDRLACIGAIGWVSAQPEWVVRRYVVGDRNYLDEGLRALLRAAAVSLRRDQA